MIVVNISSGITYRFKKEGEKWYFNATLLSNPSLESYVINKGWFQVMDFLSVNCSTTYVDRTIHVKKGVTFDDLKEDLPSLECESVSEGENPKLDIFPVKGKSMLISFDPVLDGKYVKRCAVLAGIITSVLTKN